MKLVQEKVEKVGILPDIVLDDMKYYLIKKGIVYELPISLTITVASILLGVVVGMGVVSKDKMENCV